MNQITTRYITEGDACYEQYVISDPAAKTELVITPERGGMITGFTLDGDEYIWTRKLVGARLIDDRARVDHLCSRPRFGVPVLFPNCGGPDGGVHYFDGKAGRDKDIQGRFAESRVPQERGCDCSESEHFPAQKAVQIMNTCSISEHIRKTEFGYSNLFLSNMSAVYQRLTKQTAKNPIRWTAVCPIVLCAHTSTQV